MQLVKLADAHHGHFDLSEDVTGRLEEVCSQNSDIARSTIIGHSRGGREIRAYTLGNGPLRVSLISGSHADEPVGSEAIRLFITEGLAQRSLLKDLFSRCTFLLIPQINPDAELRNARWMTEWPSLESYISNTFRELPGDDIEFGYPSMRPENVAASTFWERNGPVDVHISLHGMGFAEGVMLLIERHWTSRTQSIRDDYTAQAAELGLRLHTHNRKGEKGFFYIEDGYTTTPEGAAMQAHFRGIGDYATAELFHQSSMEYIRTLSDDPLCLVTEIPLFSIRNSGSATMEPENYMNLKEALTDVRLAIEKGMPLGNQLDAYDVKPVAIIDAIRLQLLAIELAIQTKEHQEALKARRK